MSLHNGSPISEGASGETLCEVDKHNSAVIGLALDAPLYDNVVHELAERIMHRPFDSMSALVRHNFSILPSLSLESDMFYFHSVG